jgi:TonB family protein
MKMVLATILVLGIAAPLQAQERALGSGAAVREGGNVATARDLYASARYDEALSVLNGLLGGDRLSTGELKLIEQYRSLCLLALGRDDEAEAAIASVVTADPFYRPSEEEASPRVRNTFADVRERLLPGLATARYAIAKRSYDEKDWDDAKRQFQELITLLNDPQMNGRAGDLRVLAQGFLDLAIAAATPPPAPEPAPKPVEPPAVPATPAAPVIYTGEEPGVVVPTTIRQELPPVPASIMSTVRERGLLEIVIDEQGRVASMALRSRVHPVYDSLLLNAVRDWKYRPATVKGKPVQFRKLIQFNVKK